MSGRLTKMLCAIRLLHAELNRMPTRKELSFQLGDKTLGPMTRDLRRLEAAGCIKLHPRGTISAELT